MRPAHRRPAVRMALMAEVVQIGIFGDYNPASPTLPAIEKSIQHAATALNISAEATWLPTDSLLGSDLEKKLEAFDALWAAPASPYKSRSEEHTSELQSPM